MRWGGVVPSVLALALVAGAPAADPPVVAATPAALQLFQSDWVLMNWALKFFDHDRDILLEPEEAAAAAADFRKLADTNGDGRVTPEEYRAAREAILTAG